MAIHRPSQRSTPVRSRLAREMVKFITVGGAGVLVNLLTFNFLRHATSLPVVRASAVATLVSIAFNYLGFRYFTYRDRDKSRCSREMTLFLLFSAAGLVIENGVLYAATYGLGWDGPLQSNTFKFLGITAASVFRFWSYRSWVFRTSPTRPVGGSRPGPPVEEHAAEAGSARRPGE
jgi:putative flippase GtrA